MIQAVILDGFHQGFVVRFPNFAPEICLPKPVTHTVCDCNPDITEYFDHEAGVCRYKACFRSFDGEMVLYSRAGKGIDILTNRDWITQNRDLRPLKPLFDDAWLNCHDPRAWLEAEGGK